MKSAGRRPAVVLAATAQVSRDAVRGSLTHAFDVTEASLGDPKLAELLDRAIALVALVRDAEDVGVLARARSLGAGVVLIAKDLDESVVEIALARIAPEQCLIDPVAPALLEWAVRRVARDPATRLGTPERRQDAALLGVSVEIRRVIDEIRQIADSEMGVLIGGETGTGKELVARAIHARSQRSNGPFVAVNCGALPESLLESELFGSVRGAFTGAVRDRKGLFEQAHGGTLLLDEIGDTPMVVQAKLLRVLETKRVRPIGSERERSVDVRIVSATHRDLEDCVRNGSFRQDLLYRLNASTIVVPPLRRRRADIPLLAQHFAEELGAANARRITLDDTALEALARHDFPGNVRELRNAIERAIASARPDEVLGAAHFGFDPAAELRVPGLEGTLHEQTEQLEARLIESALRLHGGNRTRVAQALGLSRLGLRQKMRRLGLEPDAGPPR